MEVWDRGPFATVHTSGVALQCMLSLAGLPSVTSSAHYFYGQNVYVQPGLGGFKSHRILSLLFAADVVLLAPSSQGLQRVLGWFAAEWEAAGMRISTFKSEAMVLKRKKVTCPLGVGGQSLAQVEKYLGVLFRVKHAL